MTNSKYSIIILRILHGIVALYFITCLIYVYSCIFSHITRVYLPIAVTSMSLEGIFVFILNKGNCPLIHIQRKIGDNIPFFNLVLPNKLAKQAIPIFSVLTLLSFVLLIIKYAS